MYTNYSITKLVLLSFNIAIPLVLLGLFINGIQYGYEFIWAYNDHKEAWVEMAIFLFMIIGNIVLIIRYLKE